MKYTERQIKMAMHGSKTITDAALRLARISGLEEPITREYMHVLIKMFKVRYKRKINSEIIVEDMV